MQLEPIIQQASLRPGGRIRIIDSETAGSVAHAIRDSGKQYAWVEGFSGVGKSTFARQLAQALQWRLVGLDEHLLEQQARCVFLAQRIDQSRLTAALAGTVLQAAGAIVEGICLRDVVGVHCARSQAMAIYVARVTNPAPDTMLWHHGFELEGSDSGRPWLWAVSNEYHRREKPHQDADLVLLRVE